MVGFCPESQMRTSLLFDAPKCHAGKPKSKVNTI
jgi:hypothetical protein